MVDVKSPEGSIVLERLIKWADIIVYNGLDRQLKDLGIDWDSVKVINPKAIIIKINCWGGPKEGPRSNYTGYDDIVQASTGVMARFGGGLDTPEEHAHMGTIDVPSGFCACFSTMVGLYQRMRTGKGQMVYSSLAAVGQLIQVPFMYDYDGRGPFNEPSGPYVKGWNAVRRSYEAKDGWFFLSVVDSDIDKIETIPELNGIKSMSEKERVDFLSNTFKKDSVTNWVNKLKEIDIGAIAVGSLNGLRDEYTHDQDGKAYHEGNKYQFIAYDNHPSGRKVVITAPCAIRPDEAKIVASRPTEKYGSSTVEVMKTLGFGDDEIKNMIEAKAIGLSWSKDYLPD